MKVWIFYQELSVLAFNCQWSHFTSGRVMLVVIGVPAQQVVTAVSTNKIIAPGRTKMAGWGCDSMIAGKINYKTQWTIIMLVTRTITHTGWVQTLAPPTSWSEMKLFATITRISVSRHQNVYSVTALRFITNNERRMQSEMILNCQTKGFWPT